MLTGILAFVISLAPVPGLAQKKPGKKSAPRAALVGTDKVRAETVSQTIAVIGRLVARRSGIVAARVAGPVAEMRVDVGDRLQKGDTVAVLVRERLHWMGQRRAAEVASYKARLAARQAELVKKNQEMGRLDRLRTNKSAAHRASKYDAMGQEVAMLKAGVAEASARLQQAEADAHLARIDLNYAVIRSPFPGVVTRRHTDVGAYVNVGQAVVSLIDDSALEVEADVPVKRIGGLKPGVGVTVRINGQTLTAKVRAVVPQENPRTRTRAVRFTADLEGLKGSLADNQSVTVAIPISTGQDVVSVHKDAVLKRRGNDMVFVVVDGAAQPRTIKIGDAVGGRFVVRDGLKVGEVVVVRGNERLFPGQPVRF
ncbi:MAG: efflux RND transporter periplasmic adaptor subunit [Alphaproteobacteria bacterium]